MGKVNFHFYSERGIVNSIIFWIKENIDNIPKICNLLKTIKCGEKSIFDGSDFDSLNIYDEFSFGQFGSPDLILKIVAEEKTYIIIVEAKISTYEDAAVEKEGNEIPYNGNASKINVQLSLRKRFMSLTRNNDIYKQEPDGRYDYARKLQKPSLIEWVNKELMCDGNSEIYYVSLTNDHGNPYNNKALWPLDYEKENNNYGYWLYKDIEKVLDEYEIYDKAWEYTIGKEEEKKVSHALWKDDGDYNDIATKYLNSSRITLKQNATALTINHKSGNAIFRIWNTTDKKGYLVEVIDRDSFNTLFKDYSTTSFNDYLYCEGIEKLPEFLEVD